MTEKKKETRGRPPVENKKSEVVAVSMTKDMKNWLEKKKGIASFSAYICEKLVAPAMKSDL